MNNSPQDMAIMAVIAERKRQDEKWGTQNHLPMVWSVILTEECGEFAQQCLNFRFGGLKGHQKVMTNLRKEAIQCAAVALAIIECLDRDEMYE